MVGIREVGPTEIFGLNKEVTFYEQQEQEQEQEQEQK